MTRIKTFDYAGQRRETFETFRDMPKGTALPALAEVDFLFFAEEEDADWAGLERALSGLGFRCSRDGELLVARSGPMPVTAEAIWEKERGSTELALGFEFYPDGWDLGAE